MHRLKRTSRLAVVLAGAALATAAIAVGAAASDPPKKKPQLLDAAQAPQAAEQKEAAPQMPKPGPEHAVLEKEQGSWDASVEIRMGPPGAPPQFSKGVETATICCGGLWLLTDFKSDPTVEPFQGHGVAGYDPAKRKYVAMWVDSEITRPMTSEGTWDPAGKTLTMRGETTGPDGKKMAFRQVTVWKDDNTRQFTMYLQGADGKESPGLLIGYTRRQ
jgi:hypothetical protein